MNYEKIKLGKLADIINFENGKSFLHDKLHLTSCEISINCLPQNHRSPFNHKHKQNEEIYIFIKGEGLLTVDQNDIKVNEGDCIKVLPEGVRTIVNTGNSELQFICVQAKLNSLENFGLKDAELI